MRYAIILALLTTSASAEDAQIQQRIQQQISATVAGRIGQLEIENVKLEAELTAARQENASLKDQISKSSPETPK